MALSPWSRDGPQRGTVVNFRNFSLTQSATVRYYFILEKNKAFKKGYQSMTHLEVLEKLPQLLAEIEERRGKKLTQQDVGTLLLEIGEAIKSGEYLKVDGAESFNYVPCADPVANRASGSVDSTMCLCC